MLSNQNVNTPVATKLHIPPCRAKAVHRPRLLERLDEGLQGKLTLVSAPAGFGKTTLVAEWVAACERPVAWLSLDARDNDPVRFLTHLVAALQGIAADVGAGVLALLKSPEPPPVESLLTTLLNELTSIDSSVVLVLDDYHVIDAKLVDAALLFLLEHLPPQMLLVIASREDPRLALARLRARGQLTELRAIDLRFTPTEAARFLNEAMGLSLSTDEIAALETRTEGWIAGLQLAAISMRGRADTTRFIRSFTGSHRFVLDYLLEEVLGQQSEDIQTFLLHTSILDRLCGPLCDAVLQRSSGQETLEYLERANLFVVPLDNERHWYRYHHLFADALRHRLSQSSNSPTDELHLRASVWLEESGLEIESFHHAAAANDMERAERLIEGKGMPLHFRGAVAPVLKWLESLPTTVLDARPSLWTAYASTLLATGQTTRIEQVIRAAETALESAEPDAATQDLMGRIAAIRATWAATQNQVEAIINESRRALQHLHPDNLAFRTSTAFKLGYACWLQGDRAAARQAYTEVISIGHVSGNLVFTLLATIGLAHVQEAENQLHLAAETYRRVLQLLGDRPLPAAHEAHLGLARILYQWNDLQAAREHGQKCGQLARQANHTDKFVPSAVLLAHLGLAQGDPAGAAAILAEAAHRVRQQPTHRIPEVAAARVLALLQQGRVKKAAHLAQSHELPISRARVHLAEGDTSAALAVLERFRHQVEAKAWADERLRVMVVQSVALWAHGEKDEAMEVLGEALALAEPGGFIRIFVDEGPPMARLLFQAAARKIMPEYVGRLLASLEADDHERGKRSSPALVEPLTKRELEVLQLIAEGLSNDEIGKRLFLALSTVKGHNQRIFGKLEVRRRTEAVARARALGLL